MTEAERIKIAIVDDHTLFRSGVTALMSEFDELKVVFEASNGQQMQQLLLKSELPQVVLMDINMPVMDGYEATAWLKIHHPKIMVLALSMYEDDKAVIKMIKSGACGYVLKQSKPRELLEAIQSVVQKGVFINEIVSGKLIRSISSNPDELKLSARELEFLKLCCSEMSYKEIADQMFVSPRTVDNYRESLFQKLNLKTRSGLVLYAIKNEIFKL
ncbi:DNA-binding response regulator [Mucilaginibacter sp. PPCGB 2223]|uniref:response regulator transcription factor n=1 Tax=Mucilaginibacter sp. PPCGB 2223 TaxID=1886027 RepID=UPI000824E25D|nr:response regulator transcription factor [Mucilaginibacter sp. PPCGB 2223]OCX52490.1 DNA-binding response regulator [Mucilaginibacter sp. PPCGB 2223]